MRFRAPLVGALICSGALSASVAHAQASDPELRPTRGPLITDAARAGNADATAVELNPGSLGLLPGGGLELVGAAAADGSALPRRGAGLYWATPVFQSSALGLGLTGVAGGAAAGAPDFDRHTTLRLAYALRLGRGAGLGVAWGHLWNGAFAGTNTVDFGLSLRPGRFVALGVTVEDAGEPRELPRLWNLELALRPLGTDRFEIALGVAHANGDAWGRVVPRARVSLTITAGLRIYAEGETVPRGGALAFADGSDRRLGLGLAFDLDHTGGALAGYAYTPGNGGGGVSFAARAHLETERRAPLVAATFVARVALEGIDDDRAFLGLVRRLRGLATDPAVAAVLFKVEGVQVGVGRIEELRDLMALLRAHGKATFAYATSPTTRDYYLAASADAIILHPAGELALTGLSQTVTFYKAAMDRIGVHVDLVRVGAFKGAMEPFVMTEQSPEVRANKNRLLDDVFGRVVDAIAADRSRAGHRMDDSEVRGAIDRALYTPEEAQRAGLIDAVADDDQLESFVARALGRQAVNIRDPDPAPVVPAAWPSRRVAILLVDGTIVDGSSQALPFDVGSFAGGETLVAALEECQRDATVGAVVLRVNSPGGSAFASDVVARAVVRLRATGKPVIVSMGDLAASGGYYIAAPADLVYADPSTLTGSIGVFGIKVDAAGLMGLLGLNVETTRRGAHADYLSPYRPWTPAEITMVTDKIHHLYALFLDTVVAGRHSRGLTIARVDELGRGQIWTGARAASLGLVDRLGGLSAAIDEATRLAHVPVGPDQLPELDVLPHAPGGLLRRLAGTAAEIEAVSDPAEEAPKAATIAPASLSTLAAMATPAARAALRLIAPLLLTRDSGFEARLPYDIELR